MLKSPLFRFQTSILRCAASRKTWIKVDLDTQDYPSKSSAFHCCEAFEGADRHQTYPQTLFSVNFQPHLISCPLLSAFPSDSSNNKERFLQGTFIGEHLKIRVFCNLSFPEHSKVHSSYRNAPSCLLACIQSGDIVSRSRRRIAGKRWSASWHG